MRGPFCARLDAKVVDNLSAPSLDRLPDAAIRWN